MESYTEFAAAINALDVTKSLAMLADPAVDVNWTPPIHGEFDIPLGAPLVVAATALNHTSFTPTKAVTRHVDWLASTDAATADARKVFAIMEAFLRSERVDVNVTIRTYYGGNTSIVCWAIFSADHDVRAPLLAILLARPDLDLSSDVGAPLYNDYRERGCVQILNALLYSIDRDVPRFATLLDNATIQGDALDGLAIAVLRSVHGDTPSSRAVTAARVAMFMRAHPQYLNRRSIYYSSVYPSLYETPIICAAAARPYRRSCNVGAVTTLLRLRADVTARDSRGNTALTASVQPAAVKMLLRVDAIDMHARPSTWLRDNEENN